MWRRSMPDLPLRVVVGKNGAYWRDYGDGYSMAVVSEDNDPVEPIAIYIPAPLDATHPPGDAHRYSPLVCEVCGVRGQVRVSIVPETAPEETS